ncbi:MAG TPA: calcium-binding protein, partial [Ramlibacter sp.]|nr:calcium-binding protein [Ramlibacter sp.]
YLSARVTVMGLSVSGSILWSWGKPPDIAHQVGDTLFLHMGDRSGRYHPGAPNDPKLFDDTVNESFYIGTEGEHDETIVVRALGVKETYAAAGIRRIVASGGKGNDAVVVTPTVRAILEFDGGEGDDNFVIGGGQAGSVIRGGDGKDRFTGGLGSGIEYYGGAGDDRFVGSDGDEYVDMGSGVNTIFSAGGNDTIRSSNGTDTVDAGDGDDVILVAAGGGSLTLTAGRDNDVLRMDSFVSTEAVELGDHQYIHGARVVSFNDSLERFEVRDNSTAGTQLRTLAGHNWGSVDLSLDAAGVIDVSTLSDSKRLVGRDAMFALRGTGVKGTLYTDLAQLSVVSTGTTFSDIVVRERDSLSIVDDGKANGGLFTNHGRIDVELAGTEALLSLDSGVISTGSGGNIRIWADDVDFRSGADKVRGTGTLELRAVHETMNYKVGAVAQSTFGRDFSGQGATGYFNFSMQDFAALRDGFSGITLGHQHQDRVLMAIGDIEDKQVGEFFFAARLQDTMRFVANDYRIMGDVQSTDVLWFDGRTMEVQRQNIQDPLGSPDSGIHARETRIRLSEQIVVSGWLKGRDLVSVEVLGSTGTRPLVGYGTQINGFTADPGSIIFSENSGGRVEIVTSGSIVSGTAISARGNNSRVLMTAGTGLTLLEGAAVSVQGSDALIDLRSQDYLHVNSGAAVLAGARVDFVGATPVYTKTGEGAVLALRTAGELSLDGSVTANGELIMDAGRTVGDHADYFDRLNGQTIAQTADAARMASLVASLNAGLVSADLRALFASGNVTVGGTASATGLANYLPFENLTDAAKLLVAQHLGYTVHEQGGFYNANAGTRFVTTLAEGVVNTGYTRYDVPVYFKADAPAGRQLVTGFEQGSKVDYSNSHIEWSAYGATPPAAGTSFLQLSELQKEAVYRSLGYQHEFAGSDINWALFGATAPADGTTYAHLTAAQKSAVDQSLGYASGRAHHYVNYNAPLGKKVATNFVEGGSDYSNDDIFWGTAGKPAAGTSFSALSEAQKRVVAHALGYEVHTGTTYYKAGAPAGQQVVKTFAAGPVQFSLQSIDFGGTAEPDEGTSFEDLTPAQRAIVADSLGYAIVDKQLFYKETASPGSRLIDMPLEGTHYSNADVNWGTEKNPGPGVGFQLLTLEQQERVLQHSGYRRFDGVVYHDAEATLAEKRYVLTFVEGTDYQNENIRWSAVAVPEPGTAFADLTPEQQFRVLDQSGWKRYDGRTFVKLGAAKEVVTTFTEGVDYTNAQVFGTTASGAKVDRWVVADGASRFVVQAVDEDNDGTADLLRVMKSHELLGQRGYGFLLTGTITNLADNRGLTITSDQDVLVRGNINLLGADSDLVLQSDKWVYWEGEARIHGDITVQGGVSTAGANLGGANAKGVSVFVHAASTLNSLQAGSDILVQGGRDVLVNGRVVAGGTIGSTGVTWVGPDSTATITAGERIVVDTAVAAAKSVTLRTTAAPGAEDGGLGIRISSAGGLTAGGSTSDGSGGSVVVDAKGRVEVIGNILSGGNVTQVFDADGVLQSETITWTGEPGTVSLKAAGQLALGGMAPTASGGEVEIGSTVRARTRIDIVGGASPDGIGVKMPGGARLATSHADGIITIRAEHDAQIDGQVVAGGEVIDHYDPNGKFLGSTRRTFNGDSVITIQADRQVRLGRDLLAGKTLDVRGGESTRTPTAQDPWADEGIVIGGNVHLKTWRENSTITLSASGDMSVLTPAWTQELSADGFAEYADGHLSADTSFQITIDIGTQVLRGVVTVTKAATAGNTGIGSLRDDLQAAIRSTQFTITSAPANPALVNTTRTLGADDITVRLNDGRLMLTGAYVMTIAGVAGGGAERLGFTQVAAATPTSGPVRSDRGYAIDASGRGSIVNLGKSDAPGGEITISGWIRGHSAINLYSGNTALGDQTVRLTASGVLETLSGGMVLNPAGHTVLEGDLIARGRGSDILINTSKTIELRGGLTAQRDVVVSANGAVKAGEVSLATFGTGRIATIDPRGRIVLTGTNDVVIDSQIGRDNPNLALVEVRSVAGKLTLADDGFLESAASIVIAGKDVDLGGVVRNVAATAASYDYEVLITATGDADLHSTFELAGSMQVKAGDDIFVHDTTLQVTGAAQRLSLQAGDAIGIGSALGMTGGAVLESSGLLEVIAGGRLAIATDAQLFSSGDDSRIEVRAAGITVAGDIFAGAKLDAAGASTWSWTGKRAAIDIRTAGSVFLGDDTTAGNLWATGRIEVQAGTDTSGLGLFMSRTSAIRADATGRFDAAAAPWTEAAALADAAIDIRADGDVQVRGRVSAHDAGADVSLLSRSQVLVDGLVTAA